MMDTAHRLDRIEDALVDLASFITEVSISRPSVLVGREGNDAGERFLDFVRTIRNERA